MERPIVFGMAKPQIMLFVGVNGSGKTTTLGKMAKSYTDKGKKVLIAAGDTFRAAAVEQLTIWGERANAPVMSAAQNADAAGLVFDAIPNLWTSCQKLYVLFASKMQPPRITLSWYLMRPLDKMR